MGRMRRSGTRFAGCVLQMVGSAAISAIVLSGPAVAAFEKTCSAAKVRAQAVAMTKLCTCYAKQVKAVGYVSDPGCLGTTQVAIASAFAKAGSCDGDAAAASAVLAAAAEQLVAVLVPRGIELDEQKCAAAKLKAAGKTALKQLKCFVKAAQKLAPVDPSCRAAARSRLATRFVAEEVKGHCRTVGDADAVNALIDQFVVDALNVTAPSLIPAPAID